MKRAGWRGAFELGAQVDEPPVAPARPARRKPPQGTAATEGGRYVWGRSGNFSDHAGDEAFFLLEDPLIVVSTFELRAGLLI
ncbi:MAG: hypothetical protein ABIG44_09075, partial [Planctomycetota bacterium]